PLRRGLQSDEAQRLPDRHHQQRLRSRQNVPISLRHGLNSLPRTIRMDSQGREGLVSRRQDSPPAGSLQCLGWKQTPPVLSHLPKGRTGIFNGSELVSTNQSKKGLIPLGIYSYLQMSTRNHVIEVIVENKPLARDPEGETIHHNLIMKGGYNQVTDVRAGKLLRMTVEASSPDQARDLVKRLCNDLRIYNPAAHTCQVRNVG